MTINFVYTRSYSQNIPEKFGEYHDKCSSAGMVLMIQGKLKRFPMCYLNSEKSYNT